MGYKTVLLFTYDKHQTVTREHENLDYDAVPIIYPDRLLIVTLCQGGSVREGRMDVGASHSSKLLHCATKRMSSVLVMWVSVSCLDGIRGSIMKESVVCFTFCRASIIIINLWCNSIRSGRSSWQVWNS